MPIDGEADAILARWAEVERDLNTAKRNASYSAVGSSEAASLRVEIDRMIDDWAALWLSYRRLTERAKEQRHAMLPAWPEARQTDPWALSREG